MSTMSTSENWGGLPASIIEKIRNFSSTTDELWGLGKATKDEEVFDALLKRDCFDALLKRDWIEINYRLLVNPAFPGRVLTLLSAQTVLLADIARHPNCPESLMRVLAKSKLYRVRLAASQNPSLPADVKVNL
jgi:hypothetical protein